jgi:multidrug efflux pump subunit AcrB
MAKNKKTGGRNFPSGKSGNPNGRPPLTKEAKELRKLTADEFIKRVNKYLHMTAAQIKTEMDNPKATVLDMYIGNTLAIGLKRGDYNTLDNILNRIIGKLKETVEVTNTGDKEFLNYIYKKMNVSDIRDIFRYIVSENGDKKND